MGAWAHTGIELTRNLPVKWNISTPQAIHIAIYLYIYTCYNLNIYAYVQAWGVVMSLSGSDPFAFWSSGALALLWRTNAVDIRVLKGKVVNMHSATSGIWGVHHKCINIERNFVIWYQGSVVELRSHFAKCRNLAFGKNHINPRNFVF